MNKVLFKGSILFGPVPVVLVTTRDADHHPNVLTVGWVGVACTKPPMISIAIRKERLSHANLMAHPEFVINLPTKDMVRVVDFCGCRSGSKIDKIKHFDLKLEPGAEVDVPSLSACPIALECVVRSVTPLGTHDLFLAEVVQNKVASSLMDSEGKIHMEWAELITYLHGAYYALDNHLLGTFGYSVARKKTTAKKMIHPVKKKREPQHQHRQKSLKSESR
jgi:flavin reductase (DIM6/NTAB) family NADH-FMN oxidoreductase RutF